MFLLSLLTLFLLLLSSSSSSLIVVVVMVVVVVVDGVIVVYLLLFAVDIAIAFSRGHGRECGVALFHFIFFSFIFFAPRCEARGIGFTDKLTINQNLLRILFYRIPTMAKREI